MATTYELNDTHLVILGAAARHPRGCALPMSNGMGQTNGIAARAMKQLLRQGLITEVPAGADDHEWRRDEEGSRLTLTVTEAGLSAIGITETDSRTIDNDEAREPGGAHVPSNAPAPEEDGRRVSEAEGDGIPGIPVQGNGAASSSSTAIPSTSSKDVVFAFGTKAASILKLLRRKRGASTADLMEASGWQAHSVRGFLSGTLKKKHGLTIVSDKDEGGHRRYRIAA